MESIEKYFERLIYESTHSIEKPYFKNLKSKFQKGVHKGKTYLEVWREFPEHIEWLILNHGLIIDLDEFITEGELCRSCYQLSEAVMAELNQYSTLINFNREKRLIRAEWMLHQTEKLPVIEGKHQFTSEYKELLLSLLTKKENGLLVDRIEKVLELLGVKMTDIEDMVIKFEENIFNRYRENFFNFLYSCIFYGCGEYYKYSTLRLEEDILQKIKKNELKEIVIANSSFQKIQTYTTEILEFDNTRFFIQNTGRNAKKDGVNIGKVYTISPYKEPAIVFNWFDFESEIESRIDILLSVECYYRHDQRL